MCFALLALGQHADYPFILAANRDEFHARAALPLHAWEDAPGVIGGRDLESTGSWLAVNQQDRRFALVTNVRDGLPQPAERSRGLLIRDLVDTTAPMLDCLYTLQAEQQRYAGFNVLAGNIGGPVYYLSNRHQQPVIALGAGLYGLSNAALDTPWPKVVRGKQQLKDLLLHQGKLTADRLFNILADNTIAQDDKLPETGLGLEKERWLSSLFIKGSDYGTRCSTLILKNNESHIKYYERSYVTYDSYNDIGLNI